MIINNPAVLDEAAEILEERGLNKGNYCDPETGAVCFWGAIYAAVAKRNGIDNPFKEDGWPVAIEPLDFHFPGRTVQDVMQKHFGQLTPHEWSDLPYTEKKHVVARLKTLASEMRAMP